MPPVTTTSVVRNIESLFDGSSVVALSDPQLVERFIAGRDATGEAAFSALVARHGPMVLGVCWQILGDQHEAEDAFQAVFFVLARKARSIHDTDLLANWLFGVALHTARKARVRRARRRKNEEAAMMKHSRSDSCLLIDPSVATPEQRVLAREQAEVLYGEIDRLPRSFRLAVVLCYFEGLTLDEAAHRLRCPAGTVRSRLARAYDKLRRGLTRRGVVMPAAGIASALSSRSASACVSSALCETTARAAMNFAAHHAAGALSASSVALAHEVLRSVLLNKLKFTVLTVLFVGAIATGAGYVIPPLNPLARPWDGEPPAEPRRNPAQTEPRPPEIAQDTNKPAAGRIFVVGRVLDTQGNPVPSASVLVYARAMGLRTEGSAEGTYPKEIGHTASDGAGRIRADVPRTSSSSHDQFGVVALAPGYGAGWLALDTDADQPVADITLPPEQIIHGRVFDLLGQPAGNVRVSVTAIRRVVAAQPLARRASYEGPRFWWAHPDNLPGWPRTVVSDAEGRFTVRGVGRGFRAFLTFVDPRYATQVVETDTDEISLKKPLAIALQPARTISGRVTYADTGKPVPNVRVGVMEFDQLRLGLGAPPPFFTTTDHEGRYRANPRGGAQGSVYAVAPRGEPYLGATQPITWPKGAITYSTDLALPRGVLIRGKVAELTSHQPVAGAIVAVRAPATSDTSVANPPVKTSADGSFVFAARTRRGYIVVNGPTGDYVRRELDEGLITDGQPGGRRFSYHAFLACDQNPGDPDHDVNLTLQACRPIKGHVVGPDGKPLAGAWILSRLHIDDTRFPQSQHWNPYYHGITHNGLFEVHGLAPDAEVSVSFLEPKLKLGATVRISGKPDVSEAILVKLAPCGTATARLVGPDGKPLSHFTPRAAFLMVVTPGEFSNTKDRKEGALTPHAAGPLTAIDPVNYPAPPASDGDGRIVFPALIPGTTYHFADRTTAGAPPGRQFRNEFTVKPGETLELGDILIEKSNAQ
jgi:RNA polymerase sigma factor (sigma-70 family)